MNQGKNTNRTATGRGRYRRRRLIRKEFVLLCSIVVLLIGMVGGSLAYLVTSTAAVKNTFTVPDVDVDITESFDKEMKEHVKFTNTSDFSVYARATYTAMWVKDDTDDVVLSETPNLASRFGSNWNYNSSDGYYYYNKILAENEQTTDFIVSMTAEKKAGYHLVVDVIVETVQAYPEQAVIDVWGFVPSVI